MKKQFLYWSIVLVPIIGMIIINEFVRLNTNEEGYNKQGITAINSAKKHEDKCSWICHNSTIFCKENHVKYLKPYFKYTDAMYFGTINMLQKTGNYGLANIIFLVILGPLIIWISLVKSINIQSEINELKKNQ